MRTPINIDEQLLTYALLRVPIESMEEFHEAGFLWGVTFEHPDLHHFES